MKKTKATKREIENAAIEIVRREKETWGSALCYITPKIAFKIRDLIQVFRKNYYGVFDEPIDPNTGRKKIWIPLTESVVESVVKNIDLDTKDINFRAKKVSSVGLVSLIRNIVKNALEEINFGEKLDVFERGLAIDGTKVWKTVDRYDEVLKKKTMQILEPDLLNIYIDPTAENIQSAYRITERGLMSLSEIKRMNWINTDIVFADEGFHKTDTNIRTSSTSKYIDIWETWGKIPKWLITGDKNDQEEIEGHIVVSGIERGGGVVHLIEKNDGIRPYEEAWYSKVPGRWYGRGVAEKLMWLQVWINTIVNIRINRSYLSQLGIFKIKRTANITPQMATRLTSNGVIMVNSMDDIEQLVIQEAGITSYKDEEVIQTWAERVTSAFEMVTGEKLPSSTTATVGAIQERSGQSQFVLIKEGIGLFLQRWIKRHVLPIVLGNIDRDEMVLFADDVEKIRELDERMVNEIIYQKIKKANEEKVIVDPQEIETERIKTLEYLKKLGKERFVRILEKIDFTAFDVNVYITNEEIDKGV
ncbi:MAG: hypothetical protein QXO70_03050, partial [Candidatus Pacearchaeota archaeon]